MSSVVGVRSKSSKSTKMSPITEKVCFFAKYCPHNIMSKKCQKNESGISNFWYYFLLFIELQSNIFRAIESLRNSSLYKPHHYELPFNVREEIISFATHGQINQRSEYMIYL